MRVTWNPSKEQANKRKHRIGFDEAATVFTDPFIAVQDDPDHSFYEYRMLAVGESAKGRLLVVSYTEYDGEIRIISARRARLVSGATTNQELMRKEYDFSKAQRGRYAGRSIKIVGSTPDEDSVSARLALKIQQAIERDMRKREVWKQMDQTQRDNLRTAWLKAIRTALNSR